MPALIIAITILLVCAAPLRAADHSTEQAARALITRLLPDLADHFTVEVIPQAGTNDVFELESQDGQIILRGNNGVAIAAALNWYLKFFFFSVFFSFPRSSRPFSTSSLTSKNRNNQK